MTIAHVRNRLVASTVDMSRRSVVVGLGFGGLAAALAGAGWKVQVLAQDATPVDAMQPAEDLNALEVLYGHPEDPAAFQEYLMNTHLPLVWEVPDIQQAIVHSSMVLVDGNAGEVYQMGTVIFASQAELEAALATAEGQAAVADVANFATGGFTAYLAHVEFLTPPGGTGTPEASPAG